MKRRQHAPHNIAKPFLALRRCFPSGYVIYSFIKHQADGASHRVPALIYKKERLSLHFAPHAV